MDFEIYDISPKIHSKTPIFPGDIPFSRKIHQNFNEGKSYSLSSIESTLHIGAHIDAPSHFSSQGRSIDEIPLENFLGPCQVLHISSKNCRKIELEDIQGQTLKAPRLLFATRSLSSSESWTSNFHSFSIGLIRHLAKKKVITLGIDTPSVDNANSTTLEVHHEMNKHGMMILEGLLLSHVPEGLYHLIALPLNIQKAEASPVRAILLPFESTHRIFFSSKKKE